MDKWLKEAKERAEEEAKDFIENMHLTADSLDIERDWFIDEVVKSIHKLKGDSND